MSSASEIIRQLKLEPHTEGGFFHRTFQSKRIAAIGPEGTNRALLSSIYYLLTSDSPIGHLHVNQSDILHFYQKGHPIKYTLVSPDGDLTTQILGPDLERDHQLQLHVPGGWWKASTLEQGEYGLISEAVSPGFDYDDMRFISKEEIEDRFPNLINPLAPLTRT